MDQPDHEDGGAENPDVHEHRQRFGQILIADLPPVQEPEQDQHEQQSQLGVKPTGLEVAPYGGEVESGPDGDNEDRVVDEQVDSPLNPLNALDLHRIGQPQPEDHRKRLHKEGAHHQANRGDVKSQHEIEHDQIRKMKNIIIL